MVPKEKRLQITISDKYPLVHELIEKYRKERKSISDYLCRLATEDQLSKSKEGQKGFKDSDEKQGDVRLPSIDGILDYMKDIKMDLANEIIRLYNNEEVSDKKVVDIYLGIRALKIQLDNTKTISDLVRVEDNGPLIYSKRDTLSKIAIDKAKGILVDRMARLKKEQQEMEKKEKLKKDYEEKNRQEIEDFKKKHPGKDPSLRNIPEDQWDIYEHPEDWEEVEDVDE